MINYHQTHKTDTGEFIVSHSDLCKLDPQLGGHPKLFYKALTTEQVEKDITFEKGNILHHWHEHRNNFAVSEINKPGEQLAKFIDEFFQLYFKDKWKADPIFAAFVEANRTVDIDTHYKYKTLFSLLERREGSHEDVARMIACIRYARVQAAYNRNLNEGTVIEHLEKQLPYLEQLRKEDGKIVLSKANKIMLENSVDAIREHPFAAKLIFNSSAVIEEEFNWIIERPNGYRLNRKAKIDRYIVDEFNKKLIVVDLKSTNYPVATFNHAEGAYYRYKLGRQLVSYEDAFFQNYFKYQSGDWKIERYNVVVQINDVYPVMVYQTSNATAYQYRKELNELELRAYYHINKNIWNLTMEEHCKQEREYIEI